jgi:UDP-glucuronate 4-epimerase
MRVAVTGAAGFIGSHLCEALLASGRPVTGIDAFTRFYARERKEANLARLRTVPRFRLEERNLLAPGLAAALAGADSVVHLAGRPGVRSGAPAVFDAGNVRATEAVVRAAARAGVRRLVLASSSSVYAPARTPLAEDAALAPPSPYGRSKLRAERLARRLTRRLGIELVVLRYFTVYGPRQRPDMAFARFTEAALSGEPAPLLGDGSQVRDFTYVGDAVDATLRALDHGRPGATYNVSGGRPVALTDALALIADATGRGLALERHPRDPREHRTTAADLARARDELGWTPRVTLEDGIARQVAASELSRAAIA